MWTELVNRIGAMLRAELSEENRFAAMALCKEVMDRHDATRDTAMQASLRLWVGRIQERFFGSPIG